MHDVRRIPYGRACKTAVWVSDAAWKEICKFRKKGDPNKTFWKRLARCSIEGFEIFERSIPKIVKHEWDGVYRVGFKGSLFRLAGFYDGFKKDFIVIDAFLKIKTGLNAAERRRIDEVVRVKREVDWRRVPDGIPRVT